MAEWPRLAVMQGSHGNGDMWALDAEFLDASPCADSTSGDFVLLWFGDRESGLTVRLTIPRGELPRFRAEVDAAADCLDVTDDED